MRGILEPLCAILLGSCPVQSVCVGRRRSGSWLQQQQWNYENMDKECCFSWHSLYFPIILFISDRKYMCHRWLTWHTVAIHIIMSSVIITFKPVLSVTMLPTATAHQSWSSELCCPLSPLWLSLSQLSSHFRLTTNPTNMSAAVATYSDKLNKVLHQKGVVSIQQIILVSLIVFILIVDWRHLQDSWGQFWSPEVVHWLRNHRFRPLMACLRIWRAAGG